MTARLVAVLLTAAAVTACLPASPAAAASLAAPVLTVAPSGGGVVGDGDPLDVDVTVVNTGSGELRAGELAFSIDQEPVAATSTLLDAIRRPSVDLLGQLAPVTRRTPALGPGATATVRARLGHGVLASLISSASGARRLYVRLRAPGDVQTVAEAAVTTMATGFAGRVELGTIVPIVAPPNSTGLVDTDAQAALTAPGGAWSDALEAVRETPAATIALDPEVLASIRLAGTSAPESATGFLDGLTALPNEVVRLPYADGDLTLEHAAGLPAALRPASFAGASTRPVAPVATDSPTPASTPAATDDPAIDDPTADASSGRLAWPVPGTASVQDLPRLRGDGTVLLTSADVKDTPARAADGPAATVGAGGVPVLVSDAQASELLTRAAEGRPGGEAALATLVGLLATDAVSGVTPRLLATVARGAEVRALDHALALLDRQGWIRGRSTTDLAADPTPVAVALRSRAVPAARVATARGLLGAESAVRDLGTAIGDPDAIVGPPRLALLALLSAEWRGDDPGWATATATATKRFRTVADGVRIADSGRATSIGTDGSLAVDVVNDLDRQVTVDVQPAVSNGRLQFTGDGTVRITVPARTSKPGKLPFRSISNGRSRVTLTLRSPDGTALGHPTTRSVTVHAGLDAVVAVVLLTLLGLLLALGVYRNVRRRSRVRMVAA